MAAARTTLSLLIGATLTAGQVTPGVRAKASP